MIIKIILIRHGQTDWNLKGIYQGHTDVDLNATGRAQAESLSRRMRDERVNIVYSSDRIRAINFANIIFKGKPIEIEPELREICFGVFEGLDHGTLVNKYPKLYSKWIADPFGIKIPGGEAPKAFKTRVLKAFNRIAEANKGKSIAIVTHGGAINIILNAVLGGKESLDFVPALASISIIDIKDGKAEAVSLNDTAHLKNG